MLTNPTHAVIGCTDLEKTARFLNEFAFAFAGRGTLSAEAARALYGLPGPAEEWRLTKPGAASGWIRLVHTPNPARETGSFDARAFAIDVYTRKIGKSVSIAAEAGHAAGPIVDHRFGPALVREAGVHGPDGLVVTLLELEQRRPSILDGDPDRLHSEVHSLVYCVKDTDEVAAFWQQRAGLKKVTDAPLGGPGLASVLGLPARELKARFVVLTDAADHPVRLQLIEFLGESGKPVTDLPLAGGLFAAAFEVAKLEDGMKDLAGAAFGEVVVADTGARPKTRGVTGRAPGGVRFELWEAA